MRKLKLQELNRLSIEEFKAKQKTPIVLVLDNIRSGLNVGSAFRTADAFALEKLYLCGITAQPPHREILKTAIGATDSMNLGIYEGYRSSGKPFKIRRLLYSQCRTSRRKHDVARLLLAFWLKNGNSVW